MTDHSAEWTVIMTDQDIEGTVIESVLWSPTIEAVLSIDLMYLSELGMISSFVISLLCITFWESMHTSNMVSVHTSRI